MADQKRGDVTEKGRQASDPLGADAALGAGQRNSGGETAAEAAYTFEGAGGDGAQGRTRRENVTAGAAMPGYGYGDSASGTGAHMMQSAGEIGGGAVNATREVLRGAIGATEEVASGLVGGVTHIAADIVHGVHDVGMEVRDGATGLIGAVGTVGGTAVHTVANLLVEVVGGLRYVVGAAMGQNGSARLASATGQRKLSSRDLDDRGAYAGASDQGAMTQGMPPPAPMGERGNPSEPRI